jgi:hypothetical protein
MKKNRGKRNSDKGARRNACPGDTMFVIMPTLAVLDLNAVLRSVVLDSWHVLGSRDMK